MGIKDSNGCKTTNQTVGWLESSTIPFGLTSAYVRPGVLNDKKRQILSSRVLPSLGAEPHNYLSKAIRLRLASLHVINGGMNLAN